MAQNLNEQKVAQLAKHKSEHVTYWRDHNKPTDENKFAEGFNSGWSDAEDASVPNRDARLNQRKTENAAACGNSNFAWVFETAYREGFDTRRRVNTGVQDTHDQKMAEMAKHKDGHIAYWKAHGNKQTDPRIFEDGFINGWCDCEQHLGDNNFTVNSMMGQRHQEHVRTFGNSPCEWAFDDGYREGFDGRKCMKPPQQAAPPAAAAPAPPTNTQQNPAPPANTQQNPAQQQPQPPAQTQPPAANPPPAQGLPTLISPALPSQPGNTHCHTPAAELPEDHRCSSECDHREQKHGLVEKLESVFHIKK